MSILAARHLAKRYQARNVVNNVSITVQSSEIVGLLGPNGAGKTTSFYMILGMIPIDGGSVHLNRRDLTHYPMHVRARMGLGYLPQEPSIFRKLSVANNVLAILETRTELNEMQQQRRLENLLRELKIGHIRDRNGESLSGGERRRVEIARALAAEPRFILFDEPFAGVDPISILDIQRIIRHLRERGIGVLITDHNVRETLGICDRSYIVSEGRIIAEGRPTEILKNPQVRQVYLGEEFHL
ncbi:MAG: lipopolysaccharide export system ATP-binding protein [Candidatus Kentron sp. G]|uniref:Lipopolysaccharide export system ATP-binding protein LptB n=1 Tax=Candidatus Kentrum sp. FM TaxID=2126340 RepID=A0A450T9Q5_9GAMM|nr:MAG: lipopolysaccharide export system ATP-binding protein [Candidatus Kentron sp. FM]VFN01403.1 MAG: lipopolysaccharide export system ATP-binding protein [Candidatus Kentron sp. G]VFJ63412.1 MAG: lipopolysaccharide export system ATP-binding protein [Candidatus Kentron sp. FM]VFK14770.1 MAG: lipopolysaccharide export system ATP-binding protein [Candidatus Kentron sp. FM]VFN04475.1 MAG: lipopolysaccharide export system ATP-binding protein [Candidatus Kentron sp. G]